jgi:hypothetical protein
MPVAAVKEETELATTWAVLIVVVEMDPIFALLPTYKFPIVLIWLLT